MSEVSRKSAPSWREAATATGFGILCLKSEKGEWFTISMVNEVKIGILADVGLRPGVMVSEAELLEKLALAALPETGARAWIQLSRDWATTFTHSRKRA
jgi:predicted RNA-binding protein (virulence factor B family)